MAAITGQNLYMAFNGTVLDTDYRDFAANRAIGTVDASAGADADRTFLTTLREGDGSIAIIRQASDTTTYGALLPGTEGTFEWAEEGTTAGLARHYVNAIVTGLNEPQSYEDLVMVEVSFLFSGAVTDTTY